ncbi:MAG: hypothetical protein AB1499_02725, partial [Nitrospirota bacterium]
TGSNYEAQSRMVISLIAFLNRSRPDSMIFLCIFLSPGFPSGLPVVDFTARIRGGLDSAVISFRKETHTVLMPDSSSPLAISPTDWLHNTHVGVKKAISTPSFFRYLPAFNDCLRRGAVKYI